MEFYLMAKVKSIGLKKNGTFLKRNIPFNIIM